MVVVATAILISIVVIWIIDKPYYISECEDRLKKLEEEYLPKDTENE